MMIQRAFIKEDCAEAAKLCERVFPAKYFVTERNLERKLVLDRDFCPEASICICDADTDKMLGFIGIKISHNQELYPNTAWLSVMAVERDEQRKGYGSLLVNKAMETLLSMGVKRIIVGEDFVNFFSGIPEPDEGKAAFFRSLGFWVGDGKHYDLEADIVNNAKIEEFATEEFEKQLSTATYNGEREELLGFLSTEFPGRWRYEVECALDRGKDGAEILLLWNADKTEVVGFCFLHRGKDGQGGLGPIGIAKKVRGNRVGEYLLREGLVQLTRLGERRVNVDWTILTDFYGKFDILPERSYQSASRELAN